MNRAPDVLDNSMPAGGQTVRLPGSARAAALHDQLYRYAEDLEQMIARNGELESRYEALREAFERHAESRAELDQLMRGSRDLHILTDADGSILDSNPATDVLLPCHQLKGRKLVDWVLPAYRDIFAALHAAAIAGDTAPREKCEIQLGHESRAAAPLIVAARALAVRKPGALNHLHWIMRDMTAVRENEFATQISSMVFESSAEAVMITDIDGEILAVNPAFSAITGYSRDEVLGRNPRFLNSGRQSAEFYAGFWKSLRESGNWRGEMYNRRKNGEIYPEWLTVSAARDENGHVLTYIAVFTDLSRLVHAEQRLSYLAHHDPLTGLPNRLLFEDRLQQMLSQARRTGIQFSVIFIDLDRFKPINDKFGHLVGDAVLRETAMRLAGAVRECDTVARLGGDEFVILAPGLVGDEDIGRWCTKLVDAVSRPVQVEDHEFSIGASFGCAEYPNHGEDEATLLRNADAAMYQAKAKGGNTWMVFEGESPKAWIPPHLWEIL